MKVWTNLKKEIKLTSTSWYFYVELIMAIILLIIIMFIVPMMNAIKDKEYIFLDLPDHYKQLFYKDTLKEDLDHQPETGTITVNGQETPVIIHEEVDKIFYYLPNLNAVKTIAKEKKGITASVSLGEDGKLDYVYYHQGYESERLINLIQVIHNDKVDLKLLEQIYDNQIVNYINPDAQKLSENDYLLPLILTLNISFMSMFIIAAHVFLDKDEGVIKAFALTAAKNWQYSLSKIGIEALTGIITTLILTIPILGMRINYPLIILFILSSIFFTSSIGLLITTCFKHFMQSIAPMLALMCLLALPCIAYMIPSWDPIWIKLIPSYYSIESIKELMLPTTNIQFVCMTITAFFTLGLIIFTFANHRFKYLLENN